MDKKYIDLHCHTTASDGNLSPEALVAKAADLGLCAIAITDHDSVNGIERAIAAGEKYGVEIVPGIELSTVHEGKELHLLGYYIDWQNEWFVNLMNHYAQVRTVRAQKMCEILSSEGYMITYEEVRSLATGNIGKPHIAKTVISNRENREKLQEVFGKEPSISDFIVAYMIKDKIANVPKERLLFKDGVSHLKKIGGIPVLAHPGYDLERDENGQKFLELFKSYGLQGIETIYYVNNEEETKECIEFYTKEAERLDLIITGGSDFHEDSKNSKIGMEMGLLTTPFRIEYKILENLKKLI